MPGQRRRRPDARWPRALSPFAHGVELLAGFPHAGDVRAAGAGRSHCAAAPPRLLKLGFHPTSVSAVEKLLFPSSGRDRQVALARSWHDRHPVGVGGHDDRLSE